MARVFHPYRRAKPASNKKEAGPKEVKKTSGSNKNNSPGKTSEGQTEGEG